MQVSYITWKTGSQPRSNHTILEDDLTQVWIIQCYNPIVYLITSAFRGFMAIGTTSFNRSLVFGTAAAYSDKRPISPPFKFQPRLVIDRQSPEMAIVHIICVLLVTRFPKSCSKLQMVHLFRIAIVLRPLQVYSIVYTPSQHCRSPR